MFTQTVPLSLLSILTNHIIALLSLTVNSCIVDLVEYTFYNLQKCANSQNMPAVTRTAGIFYRLLVPATEVRTKARMRRAFASTIAVEELLLGFIL